MLQLANQSTENSSQLTKGAAYQIMASSLVWPEQNKKHNLWKAINSREFGGMVVTQYVHASNSWGGPQVDFALDGWLDDLHCFPFLVPQCMAFWAVRGPACWFGTTSGLKKEWSGITRDSEEALGSCVRDSYPLAWMPTLDLLFTGGLAEPFW